MQKLDVRFLVHLARAHALAEDEDRHGVLAVGVKSKDAATAEHFVVWMRGGRRGP